MHFRLYHSVVSNCQVSHNCCLLQYSLELWPLDFLHIHNRELFDLHQNQIWIQMIESSIVIHHLNMIWTMYCGNVVKHSICNSVRRNSEGKSSILISTMPCWPSALKRQSQQDAQAAILACDWWRLWDVSWQSKASSCSMELPIKFEMQFHMTDQSTSGCNSTLNIVTQGSVEQQ